MICITIVIVATCWIIVDRVSAFIMIAKTVPIQLEERNRYRSYGPQNTDRRYGEALFIILRNKNGYLNASKIEPRLILNSTLQY